MPSTFIGAGGVASGIVACTSSGEAGSGSTVVIGIDGFFFKAVRNLGISLFSQDPKNPNFEESCLRHLYPNLRDEDITTLLNLIASEGTRPLQKCDLTILPTLGDTDNAFHALFGRPTFRTSETTPIKSRPESSRGRMTRSLEDFIPTYLRYLNDANNFLFSPREKTLAQMLSEVLGFSGNQDPSAEEVMDPSTSYLSSLKKKAYRLTIMDFKIAILLFEKNVILYQTDSENPDQLKVVFNYQSTSSKEPVLLIFYDCESDCFSQVKGANLPQF